MLDYSTTVPHKTKCSAFQAEQLMSQIWYFSSHSSHFSLQVQLSSSAFEYFVSCIWEIYALENVVFTLQSMGCTNHKFPIDVTQNVQMHLQSTVYLGYYTCFHCMLSYINTRETNQSYITCGHIKI